jgi:hypothetical protein
MVAVAATALIACGGSDKSSDDTSTGGSQVAASNDGKPRLAQPASLVAVNSALGHPVYWAGDQGGKPLELTLTTDGKAFVRYLNSEGDVGSPDPKFLTVATYPLQGAYEALQENAKLHPDTQTAETPDGGLVLVSQDRPQSVYIAYPGKDIEIEVYAPSAADALDTATSGDIKPAGE